jgi:hypothetical protein
MVRHVLCAIAATFLVSTTVCTQAPPVCGGLPLDIPCNEKERRFSVYRSGWVSVQFITDHIYRVLQTEPVLSILNKDPDHGTSGIGIT